MIPSLLATAFMLLPLPTEAQENRMGISLAAIPEYEGASDHRLLPVPVVDYEKGHFFISPRAGLPALGFKASPVQGLDLGVFAGARLGRDANAAEILHGLDDIDLHAVYGTFVGWEQGRFSTVLAYRRAAREGYGASLDLRLSHRLLLRPRDVVIAGTSIEWADDDYMQTWFGISPEQAAASHAGLPVYEVASGFKSASAFVTWIHRLDGSRWSISTTLAATALLDDARDSPVVERRTAPLASIGALWSF